MKSNDDKVLDRTRLDFGKYRGRTPEELVEVDPSYVVWMYENVEPKRCSRDLYLDAESAKGENDRELDDLDRWANDEFNFHND